MRGRNPVQRTDAMFTLAFPARVQYHLCPFVPLVRLLPAHMESHTNNAYAHARAATTRPGVRMSSLLKCAEWTIVEVGSPAFSGPPQNKVAQKTEGVGTGPARTGP